MQTILIFDKLNARIKSDLQNLYSNKIVEKKVFDILQEIASIIDFKTEKNELTKKLFISKNKRLTITKKFHNQFAIGHSNIKRMT